MKNPLSVRLSVFPVALWVIATGCLSMVADDAEEAQRRELHQYLKGRYLFQKQCAICHGTAGRAEATPDGIHGER